jgi:Cu+-exporting ATPase
MDGVTAPVNYATEKARVSFPATVSPEDLIKVVEQTGYTAALPAPPQTAAAQAPPGQAAEPDEAGALRQRLVVSALLAVPVVVLAMVTAAQFRDWQWLSLALAAPVAIWGAWPFHRAALVNARHRAATMDTLISVGVAGAFAWSLYALFFTSADMPGMRMGFTLLAQHAGTSDIYLDAAAGVTVLVLLGRYLEARAKRRSGEALQALASLGAKDAAVLRDGREIRVPVGQLAAGDLFIVRPGEKIATDGSWSRAVPRWTLRCSPASPSRPR